VLSNQRVERTGEEAACYMPTLAAAGDRSCAGRVEKIMKKLIKLIANGKHLSFLHNG
jgi:hypothetical protein